MKLAAAAVLLLSFALLAPSAARAAGVVGALSEAQARLNAGDYYEARELTEPLLEDESLARADRAEALRLNGLARFFLGDREGAEASLLMFLELEPEAHLDPALVPPLGIAFFEDVRARHWAEISAHIKKPPRRGHAALNLLPPFGQFQNEEPAKGWAVGTGEFVFGAVALTTYIMLVTHAHDDGTNSLSAAKTVQTINQASFVLFAGVYVYGAIDGYLGWRKREERLGGAATVGARGGLGFSYADGGAALTWSGRF